MVLNTGPLDWESSTLTTRPLLHSRNCKNFHVLLENLAEGLRSRREYCWGYVSMYENTPGNLVVEGRMQLE